MCRALTPWPRAQVLDVARSERVPPSTYGHVLLAAPQQLPAYSFVTERPSVAVDAVEAKYGIKQAMMYEWQYVPTAWLAEDTVELEIPHKTLWTRFCGWLRRLFKR